MDLQDQAQAVAALQRSKTYNEISALRAELKQMQDKEAAAPKCPYCFGSIVNGAVKCRHCASNIEWWVFEGETGPAKEGDAKNIEAQMLVEMREELAELEQRKNEEYKKKLAEFEMRFSLNCKRCKFPLILETEDDLSKAFNNGGLCIICSEKKEDSIRKFMFWGLLACILIFGIFMMCTSR